MKPTDRRRTLVSYMQVYKYMADESKGGSSHARSPGKHVQINM